MYAHSLPDRSCDRWEPLSDHLGLVDTLSSAFASAFGWSRAAGLMGRLHDIGKASTAYQTYISQPRQDGRKGPDHSTAGAREALKIYPEVGKLLAYGIAGHHAGLADFNDLERRTVQKSLEPYHGWTQHTGPLPNELDLAPTGKWRQNAHKGFSHSFLIRMLFSCLVDADFLATEQFYAAVEGREPERGPLENLDQQRARLNHLQLALKTSLYKKRALAAPTELNRLRAEILDHAVGKATLEPGVFTLTVPTGGGKTLTSLAFALEHARRHGLRRVIYVIPYTSIIEQTAKVFREALASDDDVLEHHASFDWEPKKSSEDEADDEGPSGLSKLRRAAENWAAPVVVTTAVQFFESLFARRTSQCRKLHNIAGSVVVLDEAQTLPLRLLRPCMAALNELAANYGTSIVLCTATQPALRVCDSFTDKDLKSKEPRKKIGFDIDDARELAPRPKELYATLKRVEVHCLDGATEDAVILARFAERRQMLCIVNTRAHARALYDALREQTGEGDGVYHLTTLMCPNHRRAALATIKERLKSALPVRLVATSLIEAGVDISFPEVWRAIAGLDQIAQAAGRCNREGELGPEGGRVVVFTPAAHKPPSDLRVNIECAASVFRNGLDPLSLEGVKAFFDLLYWRRGAEAMDAAPLDGKPWPILEAIHKRRDLTFEFEKIAAAFRMIDDVHETVIVPYDQDARNLLAKIAAAERPTAMDLRKLQQYAVSIPRQARNDWLASGVLRAVHPKLGDALLSFATDAHYRPETGVDLRDPERRDPHSNIFV